MKKTLLVLNDLKKKGMIIDYAISMLSRILKRFELLEKYRKWIRSRDEK